LIVSGKQPSAFAVLTVLSSLKFVQVTSGFTRTRHQKSAMISMSY